MVYQEEKNMASQVSPGIVLKERDLSNAIIVGASQITAAHASTFQKGPIGTVVNVASQKDLLSVFGAPSESNAEDWFVASEFLNYGGRLAVTRALTADIKSANGTSAANVLVKNDDDWNAGNGNGNYLVGRTPGAWANDLLVVVVDRGPDQIVTFNAAPAGLAVGDTLTFSGTGGTGIVASLSGTTASIVLDDPTRRLTTSDSLDSPDTGVVSGATAIAGGATYQNGTAVATTGGTGTGLTVNTTVNQGSILTITPGVQGTAYVTANNQTTQSPGGTGVGCTVNVVATGGAVTGITIVDAGVGYTVGDTVLIDGGSGTASFVVDTVEGPVTGVTIADGGTGYVAGDTITITGGSADATFDVGTVVDTTISLTSVKDWYTNTEIGSTGLNLGSIGPRPGTSQYAAGKGIKYDEVHVAVIDTSGNYSGAANTVLERILYVSKLTDAKSTEGSANHLKDVVNAQSTFLFTGTNTTGTINPSSAGAGIAWGLEAGSAGAPSGSSFQLSGKEETTLGGGADDYDYSASEIEEAFESFSDTETVDVDFILMGGSRDTIENTKAKANKIISIAAARKDCVAFVSPHKSNQVGTAGTLSAQQQKENTLAFFSGMTSSSYAVFDSGYKYYYDRFNDKYRYIPCNGDIAGLCVSTSSVLDDWYSPAGVNRGSLRNAIKLAYNPSKADRDELYQSRINPVVVFPGSGVTLFGDKTALSSPSAFDRINVRRLFLNLEKRVGDLAKAVLFEQNDSTTRASFSSAVNSYLSEVLARRGVTDFLVVCDDSNNTPDVIDRNEFVAELFVKPTRSINYITVTFTATKTGVSFAEVVGR